MQSVLVNVTKLKLEETAQVVYLFSSSLMELRTGVEVELRWDFYQAEGNPEIAQVSSHKSRSGSRAVNRVVWCCSVWQSHRRKAT